MSLKIYAHLSDNDQINLKQEWNWLVASNLKNPSE